MFTHINSQPVLFYIIHRPVHQADKNRAESSMAFSNLIYRRRLDKLQNVISFDVVQRTRLP